jgi:hypothetical protein
MRPASYPTAESRQAVLEALRLKFNSGSVTQKQVDAYVAQSGISYPWFVFHKNRRIERGVYSIENNVPERVKSAPKPKANPVPVKQPVENNSTVDAVVSISSRHLPKVASNVTESFLQEKDPAYEPFGFFRDLKKIISSGQFYPVYITGLSGNGKTMMVEQVCASLGREMIRANIVKTTDETDLIGSYELVDGNTILREGPVVVAMRRGAVLLLDEVDLGSEHLLCLQPILEGKSYFNKKTGEIIHPAPGFNIIATANTKGRGSEDGRFIGANMLNEAFLERFAITVEQEYPTNSVEIKILNNNFSNLGVDAGDFSEKLVLWSELIRKSFSDGAVDDLISTRRLVHIARAYAIFGDRLKAISLCLNRFDGDTRTAFLDFYSKIDVSAEADQPTPVG